jgi:endonuclease G
MPDNEYPIISYSGYDVMYNPEYKIPKWVKYELTASETDGPDSRKGLNFRPDPSLREPQANDYDYKNSGWSRGHMAPAADFKWSEDAMNETFFFTNCCPQDQSLNAGQWSTLEKKTRDCANKYGRVLVVTGPIIGENINGTIGANKVVVPDAFFKALMTDSQAIAFVMYNTSTNENMQKCAMSVDRLEEITGLDFFPEVDDELENHLESTYTLRYWGL